MPATAPTSTAIRFAAPSGRGPGISVAPLIDIVLLLICFYLIVAKTAVDLNDPSVQLPVIAHHDGENQPGELVINLRADGSITLAGSPVALPDLHQALAAAGGNDADAPAIIVRADRRLPFEALAGVQAAVRRAGYPQIVLRTLDRE